MNHTHFKVMSFVWLLLAFLMLFEIFPSDYHIKDTTYVVGFVCIAISTIFSVSSDFAKYFKDKT